MWIGIAAAVLVVAVAWGFIEILHRLCDWLKTLDEVTDAYLVAWMAMLEETIATKGTEPMYLSTRNDPAEPFFMVLADAGLNVAERFATLKAARDEASRLAGLNPGINYHVLASLGFMARKEPVKWCAHADTKAA